MISTLLFVALVISCASAGKYGPGPAPRDEYDYIIIGTGDSGAVVAKRLTDDPRNFKVLVLEAGFPSQSDLGGDQFVAARYNGTAPGNYVPARPLTAFDVPAFYTTTYNNGQAVQEHGYVPVGADWGITGNFPVYQGKIVGGSSCHNGMVWVRGTTGTFAAWNVPGWTYDDLLPYYKLTETANYTGAASYPSVHNFTGPMTLTDQAEMSAEALMTVQACAAAGYNAYTDINAQDTGCGFVPYNIKRGIRDSPAIAYMLPNLQKRNLDVLTFAQATKVRIHRGEDGKFQARGVRWVDLLTNRTYHAKASVEVILAGGPINTPKLLWFSGVGPADQLTKWGIRVKVNNTNVGRHIRNQFFLNVVYSSPNTIAPNLNFLANAALEYAQKGTGWFAASQSGSSNWLKSNPSLPYPDVYIADHYVFPPYINQVHAYTVGPSSPLYADGYITLTSSNPLDPPNLYQPVLTHPEDIQTLIKAINITRKIASTPPLASFLGPEITPGASVDSDEELEAFIRKNGTINSISHFIGSCKLGETNDPLAVVDTRLNVIGVKRLRVIDSSVFAGPVRYFPHATVPAIAERAAAFILQDAPNASNH